MTHRHCLHYWIPMLKGYRPFCCICVRLRTEQFLGKEKT